MRRSSSLRFAVLLLCHAGVAGAWTNVKVNTRTNNPEETSIAINPLDPSNVIGVAQNADCCYYATTDGGGTWSDGSLVDPFCLGDPSIAFDRRGYAYYCYIGDWSHSGIFINRSTDGGRTWMPAGVPVIQHVGSVPFEDKSYPVADWTESPHRDNLYVSWTQFDHYGSDAPTDSSRILFARSIDAGLSFSVPIKISDRGGNAIDSDETVEGAVPAVGPDGEVYVAWSGPRGIEFDRSLDGGLTFGRDIFVTSQPGGWDFAVPGFYRANGLPVTKADISGGPHRGRVYVNWSDQRAGDTDVYVIWSDDRGDSWGPVVRVNDDAIGNGRDQFFTWMDVDPVTGFIYVVFYDRREHAENRITDVYLASSTDGGAHFLNQKISTAPFTPNPNVFFGDYTGITAFAGRIRPLWMRMDSTWDLSAWTALIDMPNADVLEPTVAAPQLVVYPNPVRTWAQIVCASSVEGPIRLDIHDLGGRLVRRLGADFPQKGTRVIWWDGRTEDRREAAAGLYFVSGEGIAPARIVVIR
jgi:hypothetical protein